MESVAAPAKILVFGKNGQIGWELRRALAPVGQVIALGRDAADVREPANILDAISTVDPDVIVNAAAYTAVDRAEDDIEAAYAVNAQAVEVLAREASRRRVWLVHYSTDYVFDGRASVPYVEEDPTNPISVYGASKLAGEKAIQASGARHFILRTSWVYAARGNNFLKTVWRLARERSELRMVADQVGAPTGAELIADVTALMVSRVLRDSTRDSTLAGLYHLSAAGFTTWHGFAQTVLTEAIAGGAELRIDPENIAAISTAEFPTKAGRPLNSRLVTDKLRRAFDIYLPDWREGVTRAVQEVLAGGPP